MLNQPFNPKPKPTEGPRQSGMTVSDPRAILAVALRNNTANNSQLDALAQAINKRRKKK